MIANIFGPDLGIVVVLILLLLVGGTQLPKLARNLGLAGKEFRKAHEEAMADPVAPATPVVAPAAIPPAAPVPAAAVPTAAAVPDDRVTLSRADLDALLKEREAQGRRETS